MEGLAREDGLVKLLETIPGIGIFALLIAYEVDEISRFAHEKKFFSYLDLIPSTYASGGRTFHGRLTKQGNKEVFAAARPKMLNQTSGPTTAAAMVNSAPA